MIKDLQSMGGNIIKIASNENIIKFTCNANDIYSREILFGESDEVIDIKCIQEFDTEQLYRVSKISGLSSMLQVYQKDGFPLFFNSSIGNLGRISIFIKDKKQMQEEDLVSNDE
jgi:hypothetical protein